MVNTIQPKCPYKDCPFYGKCLEDNVLMRRCADGGMHKEDYYWLTGEIMIEEEFLQDITDDGLFMKPPKVKTRLWTVGDEPESSRRKRFGENSNALGPDEVNI